MEQSPVTRSSLLLRVRDARDGAAWERFVEVYTPFVYNMLRRRGLQPADAADVTQDVMQTVTTGIARFEYDSGRGSFRGWLFSVTRSRLNDHYRGRKRQPQGSGETAVMELLEAQPDETDDSSWETSWRRHLLECCAARIRDGFEPTTWNAFWSTAVEGQPVADVARKLGLTAGAVYIARSRVMAKLRKAVEEIDVDAVE